ncbi:MAG: GNAT family N-acetyltransferase [Candidatus Odinarchaeota archaeon]
MIEFKPITDYKPGQIQELTKNCYRGLIEYFPNERNRLYNQWEDKDKLTFQNIDTIGRHILFSCIENNLIGFFSWDDRQFPNGIVGQNCILPDCQGNGYGARQIEKIIEILKISKFKSLSAETGDHKFFIPAHKMYEKCGFKIKEKRKGDLFDIIEYIVELN